MATSMIRNRHKREDLIWKEFDGKVSAIHKLNLILAIRTAASRGDLRQLPAAKLLAEKIAKQVDDEFAELKGYRCVGGHLEEVGKEE